MKRDGRGASFAAIAGGLLMLLAALALPAAAADKDKAAADPVVREVVRMLDAKVAEPVIVRWLDSGKRHPQKLSSDDLIALQKAGASPALMEKLIDAAGETPSPAPPASPAPTTPMAEPEKPAPQPERPAPPPAAAPAPPPPAAAPAPPPATPTPLPAAASGTAGSGAGTVKVRFDVHYKPVFGDEEERWVLFVYLDGDSLSLSRPAAVAMLTKNLSFEKQLAPGHHVLRVLQERHEKAHGRIAWRNEARVAPVVLGFDLQPGTNARVEVGMDQVQLHSARSGPVSLSVRQGDRIAAQMDQVGGEADRWPALCEEVESNVEPGKSPSSAQRRALTGCLHWNDLWPGIDRVPTRDQVRAELARSQFQPLSSQQSGDN